MREAVVIFSVFGLFVVITCAIFLLVVTRDGQRFDSFRANCAKAEGHIYQPDKVAFCLTNDGRIIEIYP